LTQIGSGWVDSATYESGKIFPKTPNFFLFGSKNLIGSGQKIPGSRAGQPLIYRGSKICPDQVGSLKAHFFVVFFYFCGLSRVQSNPGFKSDDHPNSLWFSTHPQRQKNRHFKEIIMI